MHLLVPANSKQLTERARWFKSPVARELHDQKGVDFGFESKGEPETIKESPPLYWGYHLPNDFASEWYYHPEKRRELLSHISHLSSLEPAYVNMHGIHLWWQPSLASKSEASRGGPPSSQHLHRYQNHSEPKEILKVLNSTINLIKNLKKHFKVITIENFPLYTLYEKNGRWIPETYLYTGAGRLNDMQYIKKKTGAEIMLDIEHLILTLNFLCREKNYRDIPIEKLVKPTREEQKINKIFGFYLPVGGYPYVDGPIKISDVVKKLAAQHYHLTGSTQDVIAGKRDLTHGPIKIGDKIFRKNLRLVLAQKPETILLETASRSDNACYHYLRPNETELSFYTLCEILLEEM